LECEVIYPTQVTDFDKIPLQVSILWHTPAIAVKTYSAIYQQIQTLLRRNYKFTGSLTELKFYTTN
jgi:hypothetical protein